MIDTFLIPQDTVLTGKGDTEAVNVEGARESTFLFTLTVSDVVEQESLDVAIYGSDDGATWGEKPLASFPQQFYPGEAPLLANVGSVKFLRAHWETNRWGRGPTETMFKARLRVREVPREMLG